MFEHFNQEFENSGFGPAYGGEPGPQNQTESSHPDNRPVGYSQKINDPRVAAVLKKIGSSGVVFTFILAALAVIGFTVAGAAQVGGFELPSALYMGLGFGGLLLVIALIQKIRGKKDKTWDGTLVDKRIKEPTYTQQRQGHYTTEYILYVRKSDGKTKKISATQEYFNYLQIGDQLRHHAGTADFLFEKYDKSRDSSIYCIACTSKNDINNDLCYRCKCPLLN